ncbi:hypothetical protein ACGVWS_08180 [Enterobacteriaceae bacterium LUAb1]
MFFIVRMLTKISCFIGILLISTGSYARGQYVDAGNVLVQWKLNKLHNAPSVDPRFTNLTFRFNVNNETMHNDGTYFAQQFHFENTGSENNTGYLGLQPRKNRHGQSYMKAIFSSFIAGSKTHDRNCHSGADGGPGVSCAVLFPATYGRTYEITIHQTAENTWSGEVRDQLSGEETHIGSWTLPDSFGKLLPSGEGFAEYYAFYKPNYPQFVVPDCSQLAKINVFYGPVTTTDFGGGIGSITNSSEYNSEECQLNNSGFDAQPEKFSVTLPNGRVLMADGQKVIRGFVSHPEN